MYYWQAYSPDPGDSTKYKLKENDYVNLLVKGERPLIMQNVLVRTSVKDFDEVHIDTDEANAGNIKSHEMLTVQTL